MRRIAGTILALAVLAACAGHGSVETPRAIASAIQGGFADTQHTFAVGVCGGAPGDCSLACSGVLIAPNLVVTARHCVEVANDATIDCATSQFAEAIQSPSFFWITTNELMHQSTNGWHAVSQILTPGLGESAVCGDDLALLLLSDVIASSEATPATPNVATPLTDESVFDAAETAIGYGLSSGSTSPDTSGVRRMKGDVPIVCMPHDPDTSLACATSVLSKVGDREMVSGDATCEGDSGSGAFAQKPFDAGEFLVIGVLSRGSVNPNDATQCQSGVYTRLDEWSAFLTESAITAAQLGGYAAPSWTIADAGSGADGSAADAAIADAAPESSAPSGERWSASGGCAIGRAARRTGESNALGWPLFAAVGALARARRRRRAARQLS